MLHVDNHTDLLKENKIIIIISLHISISDFTMKISIELTIIAVNPWLDDSDDVLDRRSELHSISCSLLASCRFLIELLGRG